MVKVKTISIKQLSTSSLHTNLFRRQRNMTGFVRSARPIAVRETREVERERETERERQRHRERQRKTGKIRDGCFWNVSFTEGWVLRSRQRNRYGPRLTFWILRSALTESNKITVINEEQRSILIVLLGVGTSVSSPRGAGKRQRDQHSKISKAGKRRDFDESGGRKLSQ